TDAQSVTVQYTVSQADFAQPLPVEVWRGPAPCNPQLRTDLLGTTTIAASDLTQGVHPAVRLLSGTALPPNTSRPCIIVVVNPVRSVPQDATSLNTTF